MPKRTKDNAHSLFSVMPALQAANAALEALTLEIVQLKREIEAAEWPWEKEQHRAAAERHINRRFAEVVGRKPREDVGIADVRILQVGVANVLAFLRTLGVVE